MHLHSATQTLIKPLPQSNQPYNYNTPTTKPCITRVASISRLNNMLQGEFKS